MMTPRERVLKVLNNEKPDQVPWFGDLDYWASALIRQGEKPEGFAGSADYIEWHRELDVGFYLQGFFPLETILENVEEKNWHEGNLRFREIVTSRGTLRESWKYLPDSFTEAPVEHLVKSAADLPAYRELYENTRFEPSYDYAHERLKQIRDQGLLICYMPKSPLMHLVALEAGIMAVACMEYDAPDEFAHTLDVMKKCFDQAAQIAVESPADALMIPENLSAEMVGPRLFEKYMRSYQEEWIAKSKEAGKYTLIHMDGTLKGLLKEEASTGVTIIEAMTPSPVGDLPIDKWADESGNSSTVLWGGIPGSYFTPKVTEDEFERHIKHVLSVMRTSPRYVLGVADQVPPDGLEQRVRRVAELVAENGSF